MEKVGCGVIIFMLFISTALGTDMLWFGGICLLLYLLAAIVVEYFRQRKFKEEQDRIKNYRREDGFNETIEYIKSFELPEEEGRKMRLETDEYKRKLAAEKKRKEEEKKQHQAD